MTTESNIQIQDEEYSGASLDTIEVPDEDVVILQEMAEQPKQDKELEGGDDKDKEAKAVELEDAKKDEEKEAETQEERKKRIAEEISELKKKDKSELTDKELKRIERYDLYDSPRSSMVKKWHQANESRAAAEAKAEVLEQELAELKKKVLKKESDSDLESLKTEEADLLRQRKEAEDDGDLEAYSQVNDKYQEIRFKRMQAESIPSTENNTHSDDKENKDTERASNRDSKDKEQPQRAPEADAWLKRNQWYFDPDNAHLASYVEDLESQLVDGGMEIGTKLYQKMDQILADMPDFEGLVSIKEGTSDDEGDKSGKQESKPRHMLPPTSAGTRASNKPKPGELSQYDRQTMKRFGLDPTNDKHKAAYLKRKSGASK